MQFVDITLEVEYKGFHIGYICMDESCWIILECLKYLRVHGSTWKYMAVAHHTSR